MKKEVKTRLGREFWESAIVEQVQLGVTISSYCRDRGLEQATFYAWRKRLGDGASPSKDVSFTPITVKEIPVNEVELLLPGGLILRFSGLAPVDYLRQLSAAYVVV